MITVSCSTRFATVILKPVQEHALCPWHSGSIRICVAITFHAGQASEHHSYILKLFSCGEATFLSSVPLRLCGASGLKGCFHSSRFVVPLLVDFGFPSHGRRLWSELTLNSDSPGMTGPTLPNAGFLGTQKGREVYFWSSAFSAAYAYQAIVCSCSTQSLWWHPGVEASS